MAASGSAPLSPDATTTAAATASTRRPPPSRKTSYTHVFPARRRTPANPSLATLPNLSETSASSASRSHARFHQSFDQVSTFHNGLDWLIEAAVESEPKRQPTSLRGDALTEASLRTLNRHSERSGRSIRDGTTTTKGTGSVTAPSKMKTETSWSSSEGEKTASSRSKESD